MRETEEIHSSIDVLCQHVDKLKVQVYDMVTKKYLDFYPQFSRAAELSGNVDKVAMEMKDLSDKIEDKIKSQLNTSTEFLQNLTVKFQEKAALMAILEDLMKIQDGLETLASANENQDYLKAAEAVTAIDSLLPSAIKNHDDVQIFKALRTEFHVQKADLEINLKNRWKDLIVWRVEDSNYLDKKNYELEIACGEANVKVLTEIVSVYERLGLLNEEIKKFGGNLLDNFLKPCITDKETALSNPKGHHLATTWGHSSRVVPPAPCNAFSKINVILAALEKSLLHIKVESNSKRSLMEILGTHIRKATLEILVKDCLTRAIPTNTKELEAFEEVIHLTISFNENLVKLGFITEAETTLLDFTQNVSMLFANKKCQEILEKARKLMTTDTHNTVEVNGDAPLGDLPPLGKDGPSQEKSRKLEMAKEYQLSSNTFRLPSCHISVCVQELMCMAYSMLQEATESSSETAIQIFYAVRKMFEMFCYVFPTYHKKSLDTFPQLSAIFHNNCMFISHHLMTLGHQFRAKLPSNLNATFVDLVERIRKLGVQNFLQQLAKQKDLMSEYLQGAKGFANVSSGEVQVDAERAIKQMTHQLQHLQKVWQGVLPSMNYRKAIGMLLNSVVEEITGCVVVLEDISSDDALQLASLFKMLQDKSGPLMAATEKEKEEINVTVELQKNVSKWLRFKELIIILNANLMEISNRWADGKGPLANEFSANEVKMLIRALFQNTERRSTILLKIK
ncbi:hypothetical protein FSP39_018645 [Pinctada imbricata]|uniref:Centromere/kinetochore protein zw10 homolog n=1 Tax=Pinctada imbricata TaxID=66713 RepID=A0AA88XX77_PINIB|nr:hypothetical protein FSP39_018645 [Pinctada imbricata]